MAMPTPTPTPTPVAGDARLHIDAAQIAVGDFIGEGASGQVYAGVWRPGGTVRRAVALKFLPEVASLAPGSAARQKVDAELRIMQLASEKCGAGACELLGTSVLVPPGAPPRFCIVMKLYAGGSLARLLGEGPLERARATRFAAQLCRAVAKLHRSEEHGGAGILLRDIKPQNVLLDDETDALAVADFGISHLLTHTAYVPTSAAGTFNYMAPEAINQELGEIGRGSDVWSLGCVLGQLFGAPMPFAGNNMMQIMMKVVMQRRAPDVPEDAPQAALLRRCFAYAAADRPSAAELCGAFTPDTAPRECVVCYEELAPSAGVFCDHSVPDERHFYCMPCLCECVKNECPVGGRFESELLAGDAGGAGSAKGELPCLMFPQVRLHLAPQSSAAPYLARFLVCGCVACG